MNPMKRKREQSKKLNDKDDKAPKSIQNSSYFPLDLGSSIQPSGSGHNAYERHKALVESHLVYQPLPKPNTILKTDVDVLKEHHEFLRSDEPNSWEARLASKYYDQLFKEYCLVDLSRYKENKFAMRWRIKDEVISGKGQFICGSLGCTKTKLHSWEVNFGYVEKNIKKNALVKLRLCPDHSYKLNFKQLQEKEAFKAVDNEPAFTLPEDANEFENLLKRIQDS